MRPGDLTLTGRLYEGGDFKAWCQQMNLEVRVENMSAPDFQKNSEFPYPTVWRDWAIYHPKTSDVVLRLIYSRVSPSMLARVPANDRKWPGMLIKRLGELAQPFKLLELTKEARDKVYVEYLGRNSWTYRDIRARWKKPPLSVVNRQVRDKVRQAYFSSTNFAVDEIYSGVSEPLDVDQIQKWLEHEIGNDRRLLRSFVLWLRPSTTWSFLPRAKSMYVHFWLSKDSRLQVETRNLASRSQALIEEHAANVEL